MMDSPNSSPWNVVWLSLWAIFAIVLLGSISHSNNNIRGYTRAQHDAEIRELKKRHAEELFLKEQDLRSAARDSAERREMEFQKALGGSVQSAFKNPDYSLREALQRAALACAPTNADVRVEVDRFTEFGFTFSSDQNFATNQMVQITRQLLPVAKTYLDSVRFSVKGSVVAELDRQDIEYAKDWSRVPNDRIVTLLARELPIDVTQDRASIERLRQERELAQTFQTDPALRKKASAAQKQFMSAVKSAYEDLNAALALAEKSTSLGGVKKLSDLDARLKDLNEASQRAATAKKFWADPAKVWRETLTAQEISGDALEALVKSLPIIFRHDAPKSAKVFQALEGRIESSRYFLKVAGEQFGKWAFDEELGQFGFTTADYSRRFNRARDQAIADSQDLEAALRAWNESVTP